jgi:hypothetical protein
MSGVRPVTTSSVNLSAAGAAVAVEPAAFGAAVPRAAVARPPERPEPRTYRVVLAAGAVAVASLPVLALAGIIALLAVAVSGPYFGLIIVAAAFALLALLATAVSG